MNGKMNVFSVLVVLLGIFFWVAAFSTASTAASALCIVKCHPPDDVKGDDVCRVPKLFEFPQSECSCFTASNGFCTAECDGGLFINDSGFCLFAF